MRQLIFTALGIEFPEDDPDMRTSEGKLKVYAAGSLGVGDIPASPHKPFMIIRIMGSARYAQVRRGSRSKRHAVQLYCYDQPGSLLRIDRLLQRASDKLESLEGVRSPSGVLCIGAEATSLSQDFTDEQYEAIVRFATIQMSASQ